MEEFDFKDTYPRVILGLDVSTNCIGISIVEDDGKSDKPKIIAITHKSPRIPKKIKGIEALCLKKFGFDEGFLKNLNEYTDKKITDVVIEEPLLSSNNIETVAVLLRFNGMIADAVYNTLGIVPVFISSYDARMFSFPQLVSLRKFDKSNNIYSIKHIEQAIKKNNVVLFGSYQYDCDKKTIMMNMVNDLYKDEDCIPWQINKFGDLKKENYDSCDALVCCLAYVNINRYGFEKPSITSYEIHKSDEQYEIDYNIKIFGNEYQKKIIVPILNDTK